MTTLIAWVSYDPKFAAAYIASDSRISWSESGIRRWDAGRKIFACKSHPDVLAYAGDVIFPALVLSQITEALDAGVLVSPTATPWDKHEAIKRAIQGSFALRNEAQDADFFILHLTRLGQGREAVGHAWVLEYSVEDRLWTDRVLHVPSETGVIERLGSGASAAKAHLANWTKQAGYSREIFSSFCDAISSTDDPRSGGTAQLAGFYPRGPARSFGVMHNGEPFFHGLRVNNPSGCVDIEWRDRLFHRIDPDTKELVAGAQRHARPRD